MKYISHARDDFVPRGYCASLPTKRDHEFTFANSSPHGWFDMVERLKIAILIRKRTPMLDFSGTYLLLGYKATGALENFREMCQNSITANKSL